MTTNNIVITNDPQITVIGDSAAVTAVVPISSVLSPLLNISISTPLQSGVDFNTVTNAGFYYTIDATSLNTPVATQFWYLSVDVYGLAPSTYCVQTAVEINASTTISYQRTQVNGAWGAWQQDLFLNSSGKLPAVDGSQLINLPVALNRGFIGGLTLSTAGSSATFSVSPGQASDSTNVINISLPSSISKTTATWAVGSGNGALDTGTIAASTWYHVHLIERTDTGVVDVLVSLSPTTPTLPASYTKFRRIGSLLTNGSNQWTSFVQVGDEFLWTTAFADVTSAAGNSASRQLVTTTVPTGVQVRGMYRILTSGTTINFLFTSPDESDQVASAAGGGITIRSTAAGDDPALAIYTRTNTSAQIGVRSNGAGNYWVTTYGWFDRRGQDS